MATDPTKVMIQLTPELRKQLQLLKIKYNVKSYDEVLEILLKKHGYWNENIIKEEKY